MMDDSEMRLLVDDLAVAFMVWAWRRNTPYLPGMEQEVWEARKIVNAARDSRNWCTVPVAEADATEGGGHGG